MKNEHPSSLALIGLTALVALPIIGVGSFIAPALMKPSVQVPMEAPAPVESKVQKYLAPVAPKPPKPAPKKYNAMGTEFFLDQAPVPIPASMWIENGEVQIEVRGGLFSKYASCPIKGIKPDWDNHDRGCRVVVENGVPIKYEMYSSDGYVNRLVMTR